MFQDAAALTIRLTVSIPKMFQPFPGSLYSSLLFAFPRATEQKHDCSVGCRPESDSKTSSSTEDVTVHVAHRQHSKRIRCTVSSDGFRFSAGSALEAEIFAGIFEEIPYRRRFGVGSQPASSQNRGDHIRRPCPTRTKSRYSGRIRRTEHTNLTSLRNQRPRLKQNRQPVGRQVSRR